jgi:hypothetical protein
MKHLLVPVLLLAVLSFAYARSQDPAPAHPRWEYEVVGLTDIYGNTLDYLKGALAGEAQGLLELAKKTDEQLVAKTRDLLNKYGAEGWELAEYRENVMVFKRLAR